MTLSRRAAPLLAAIMILCALSGCVADAPEPLTLDQIRDMGMSLEQKQADLPEGFPVQVPVIAGEVLLVSDYDQGNGLWLYDIHTDYELASAAEWYRRMYPIANWELLRDTPQSNGEVVTLEFAKGDARSTVVVRLDEGGALVEASVAFDAPASDTF